MKTIFCQNCGAQVDLPDLTAGRSAKCSRCGSVSAVLAAPPDKDDLMRFVEAEAADAAKGTSPTAPGSPGSPEPALGFPRPKTESSPLWIGNPSMAIRLRGVAWIAVGIGLFLLIFYLVAGVMYSPTAGRHDMGAIKFAAWPLVLALVGAMELISGYRFHQLAAKWDAMHVLVRFLLGLVLVAILVPLIWLLFEAFMR